MGLKGMETAFLNRCEEFWEEVDGQREKVDRHPQCVGVEERS